MEHPSRYFSQLGQDQWVLEDHGPDPGYFVEVGACDGQSLSNTLALERAGWTGVCVEPNPVFYQTLRHLRSCLCSDRCVFSRSGLRLAFNTCPGISELGGLVDFFADDWAAEVRRRCCQLIEVETISLLDLLRQARAPRVIDYISLDTEGSELEILATFDFDAYDVRRWSIEHNHTPARQKIYALLQRHGYARVAHRRRSLEYGPRVHPGEIFWHQPDFDDWYRRG